MLQKSILYWHLTISFLKNNSSRYCNLLNVAWVDYDHIFIITKNANNSNIEANIKRVQNHTFRKLPGFASIFLEFQKSVALHLG